MLLFNLVQVMYFICTTQSIQLNLQLPPLSEGPWVGFATPPLSLGPWVGFFSISWGLKSEDLCLFQSLPSVDLRRLALQSTFNV